MGAFLVVVAGTATGLLGSTGIRTAFIVIARAVTGGFRLTGIRASFIVVASAIAGNFRSAGIRTAFIVIAHRTGGIAATATDKRAGLIVIPSITLGISLYTADITAGRAIKLIGRCLQGNKSENNRKQNEGRCFHIKALIAQIQANCKDGLARNAFFC